MNVIQTVITTTLFLPMLFGCGGGEMKTVDLYSSGDVSDVNYIIENINGDWIVPDSGMDDSVIDVLYDRHGTLYACGLFTTAGGGTVNQIAKYDGISWSALDGGGDGEPIRCMAFGPDDSLYVGGEFVTIGADSGTVNHIAKWDGSAWSALDDGSGIGVDGEVYALDFDAAGNLYVGGEFDNAGGTVAASIAKWDGSAWTPLADGVLGTVWDIDFGLDGTLYAGGVFSESGIIGVNNIAKWNGTAWSAFAEEPDSTVLALEVAPNGVLYVGGAFADIGTRTFNYIAAWNGSFWDDLDNGLDGYCYKIHYNHSDGRLYVGGGFTQAGDLTTVDRIAVWGGGHWENLDIDFFGTPTLFGLDSYGTKFALGLDAATVGDAVVGGEGGSATIDNEGTDSAWPRFIITRAGGTSAKLEMIANLTTGDKLLFDWALLDGERIDIVLTPGHKTITSSFSGNAIDQLQDGSDIATFRLAPGVNDIRVMITEVGSPTLTAFIQWQPQYDSIDSGAY